MPSAMSTNVMKVSKIFNDEPVQWGLRGDPYLWREMAQRLKEIEMPYSAEQLQKLIVQTYEECLTSITLSGLATIMMAG